MTTIFISPLLWKRFNRAVRRREEGQALVLVALLAIATVAAVGLSVDGGMTFLETQKLQRAADNAALAGVPWMPRRYSDIAIARASASALSDGYNVYDPASSNPVDTYTYDEMQAGTVGQYTYFATQPIVGRPNQLRVIMGVKAPRYFLGVLGFTEYTIVRQSIAEYIQPSRLGGSFNYFGSSSIGRDFIIRDQASKGDQYYKDLYARYINRRCDQPTRPDPCVGTFWLSTQGPDTAHANGDAYTPLSDGATNVNGPYGAPYPNSIRLDSSFNATNSACRRTIDYPTWWYTTNSCSADYATGVPRLNKDRHPDAPEVGADYAQGFGWSIAVEVDPAALRSSSSANDTTSLNVSIYDAAMSDVGDNDTYGTGDQYQVPGDMCKNDVKERDASYALDPNQPKYNYWRYCSGPSGNPAASAINYNQSDRGGIMPNSQSPYNNMLPTNIPRSLTFAGTSTETNKRVGYDVPRNLDYDLTNAPVASFTNSLYPNADNSLYPNSGQNNTTRNAYANNGMRTRFSLYFPPDAPGTPTTWSSKGDLIASFDALDMSVHRRYADKFNVYWPLSPNPDGSIYNGTTAQDRYYIGYDVTNPGNNDVRGGWGSYCYFAAPDDINVKGSDVAAGPIGDRPNSNANLYTRPDDPRYREGSSASGSSYGPAYVYACPQHEAPRYSGTATSLVPRDFYWNKVVSNGLQIKYWTGSSFAITTVNAATAQRPTSPPLTTTQILSYTLVDTRTGSIENGQRIAPPWSPAITASMPYAQGNSLSTNPDATENKIYSMADPSQECLPFYNQYAYYDEATFIQAVPDAGGGVVYPPLVSSLISPAITPIFNQRVPLNMRGRDLAYMDRYISYKGLRCNWDFDSDNTLNPKPPAGAGTATTPDDINDLRVTADGVYHEPYLHISDWGYIQSGSLWSGSPTKISYKQGKRQLAGAGDLPNVRGGVYMLQVQTFGGQAANRYAVKAEYENPLNITYVFSSGNVTVRPVPQVYGITSLGLFVNAQNNSSGQLNVIFDLAYIPSQNAGANAVMELWDSGDVGTDLAIQILEPSGYGQKLKADNSVAVGAPITVQVTVYPFYNNNTLQAVNSFAPTPYVDARLGGTQYFNDQWILLSFVVPNQTKYDTYKQTCDLQKVPETLCYYYQVNYRMAGNGSANDTTTWQLRIENQPVRIVS